MKRRAVHKRVERQRKEPDFFLLSYQNRLMTVPQSIDEIVPRSTFADLMQKSGKERKGTRYPFIGLLWTKSRRNRDG